MRLIFALVVACLSLSPCAAYAVDLYVQAESFTSSHNIMPLSITTYDLKLVGLDYEGEWAEFQVTASVFGTYTFWMRCWGNQNSPYLFHLRTRPVQGGEPQTITVSFAGKGTSG